MQPLISDWRPREQREVRSRSSATKWMLSLLAVACVHSFAVLALWFLSDWRLFSSQEPLMIELVSAGAEISQEAFIDSPEAVVEPNLTPPVSIVQSPAGAQTQTSPQLQESIPASSPQIEQVLRMPPLEPTLTSTEDKLDLKEPIDLNREAEPVELDRPILQSQPLPTPRLVEPSPRPPASTLQPQPIPPQTTPQPQQPNRATTRPTATASVPTTAPDIGPKATSSPKPPYPSSAFKAKQEGRVVLELEVLEDGAVGQVRLAQSSNFDSLDASALATVKKWQYSPAQKGGKIVKQWIRVSILFEVKAR